MLAVLAIRAKLAVPSYEEFRTRSRLKGAAENLATDLQFARSEAVARNAKISVSFSPGGTWCYGIHQGTTACNCTVVNSCSIKAVPPPVSGDFQSTLYAGVTMSQAVFITGATTRAWFVIDPIRGQITDAAGAATLGSATFATTSSGQMRTVLNTMGRIRHCSPAGSVPGYPTC